MEVLAAEYYRAQGTQGPKGRGVGPGGGQSGEKDKGREHEEDSEMDREEAP